MGCVESNLNDEEKAKRRRNKLLESELASDARKEDAKIKLLLLGAGESATNIFLKKDMVNLIDHTGESGKSTVFKQMKVIYGATYTTAERKQQIPTIHSNIIQGIKARLAFFRTSFLC